MAAAKRPDATIHQGAVAPYAFRYVVTSSDTTNFDLSTVTSALLKVLHENGDIDEWSAGISDQSTTSLTLSHVFTQNDVPEPGDVVVEPRLTSPSGDFVCEPKTLRVRKAFT